MSQLSYSNYEARLQADVSAALKKERAEYKPYMALNHRLRVDSVEYKPTFKGIPRWIAHTTSMPIPLTVTMWQEDIDFIHANYPEWNIGEDTITFGEDRIFAVMVETCNPKYGLQRIDAIFRPIGDNGYVFKSQIDMQTKAIVMVGEAQPLATPIAMAIPEKPQPEYTQEDYDKFLGILNRVGVVALPYETQNMPVMLKLVEDGHCIAPKHNTGLWFAVMPAAQETVTPVTIAIVPKPFLFAKGDTVTFNGKPYKVIHRFHNGSGGFTWYGVQGERWAGKGNPPIIFRKESDFQIAKSAKKAA